jgi:hypothetical protein
LVKPGGWLALEEWDLGSWHFNPPARAADRLIRLISEIFAALGGEAGRGLPELLRDIGIEEPERDAHVIALKPGHPYLRLPLQFSLALESRLLEEVNEQELATLRRDAESELPSRAGGAPPSHSSRVGAGSKAEEAAPPGAAYLETVEQHLPWRVRNSPLLLKLERAARRHAERERRHGLAAADVKKVPDRVVELIGSFDMQT